MNNNKINIQIGIITYSINGNNEKLINTIIFLLHKLAKKPNELEFFIINHYLPDNFDLNKIKLFVEKNKINVKYFNFGNKILSHPKTLEKMICKYTAKYGFFFDTDLFCLKKNWDEFFISKINKKNTIAIGTSYHKTLYKYQNLPNIMGFFFKTKVFINMYKSIINEDKNPEGIYTFFSNNHNYVKNPKKLILNGKIIWKNGYYYNNSYIRSEIGYLFPLFFDKFGYKGIPLKCKQFNHDKMIISNNKFLEDIKLYQKKRSKKIIGLTMKDRLFEEYHYDNELIFLHIGAGSYIKWDLLYKTRLYMMFIDKICEYILNKFNIDISYIKYI